MQSERNKPRKKGKQLRAACRQSKSQTGKELTSPPAKRTRLSTKRSQAAPSPTAHTESEKCGEDQNLGAGSGVEITTVAPEAENADTTPPRNLKRKAVAFDESQYDYNPSPTGRTRSASPPSPDASEEDKMEQEREKRERRRRSRCPCPDLPPPAPPPLPEPVIPEAIVSIAVPSQVRHQGPS